MPYKDPEKRRELCRRYYEQHREAVLARQAGYRQETVEYQRERRKVWKRANSALMTALANKRRAWKLQAVTNWEPELDQLVEREASRLKQLRRRMFGFAWHVDHVVPLKGETVCGLHNSHNLAVIPGSLNIEKSNKVWPDMF
jgi:5-methylcytosine-specific restriction endonuclease McrA